MVNPTSSDPELLAVWLTCRSEPAFRAIVTRYAALVHSAAKRTCGNEALAADASQLAFILLAQKAKTLTSRTSLAGWLHITAVMYAKRLIAKSRRETRKIHHLQTFMAPHLHGSHESYWPEIQPVLDEALSSLSQKDRETLLLKFYRSLTVREIATTLGIGTDAAQKRLIRATERLRQKLTRRGIHLAGASFSAILAAGITKDAHAATCSLSTLTSKAITASNIPLSITTSLIIMTHKTILTTAAAVVLTGTIIAAASSGSRDKNSTSASSSSHSNGQVATESNVINHLRSNLKRNSRLRPSIAAETATLNEKFGAARVKFARQYVKDLTAVIQTKISIISSHLEFFKPENKNEDQLGKILFGESSDAINLSHEQCTIIKKNYSIFLQDRITNLTKISDGLVAVSADLTTSILCVDAKIIAKFAETEFNEERETYEKGTSPLVGLWNCNEHYISPSILDESRMASLLDRVLSPQQENVLREKSSSGSIKLTGPIQPADTLFIYNDFASHSKLEDLSKKMSDTRQEMNRILQSWKDTVR